MGSYCGVVLVAWDAKDQDLIFLVPRTGRDKMNSSENGEASPRLIIPEYEQPRSEYLLESYAGSWTRGYSGPFPSSREDITIGKINAGKLVRARFFGRRVLYGVR